ncbi:MAG: hypothetical protein LBC59_04310 [Chitinispirillales bacterium]|jgi:predicted transposase YdaD|nr:hypothetical protein [Chitinispirillales bacterium]
MTMTHGLAAWRDEMIDEAKCEAKHEEDVKIASAMKTAGMDVYTVSKFTGLTIDEILQL